MREILTAIIVFLAIACIGLSMIIYYDKKEFARKKKDGKVVDFDDTENFY